MNLKRLSELVSLFALLVGVTCLGSIWAASHFYRASQSIAEQRYSVSLLTSRMFSMNRRLTHYARLYSIEGDESVRRQYMELLQSDEFGKSALELQGLQLTAAENRHLSNLVALNQEQIEAEHLAIQERATYGHSDILASSAYVASEIKVSRLFEALRNELQSRQDRLLLAVNRRAEEMQLFAGLMLGIAVLYALAVFFLFIRRGLIQPLQALTEQTRLLQAGNAPNGLLYCRQRGEVGALARALEDYYRVNQNARQQQWVKERIVELSEALQRSLTFDEFSSKLQVCLSDWLSGALVSVKSGDRLSRPNLELLHYSVPLRLDGKQVAALEVDFLAPPENAHFMLLDALSGPLGTLWGLLQQQLHNQELLEHAFRQARELQFRQEALVATEGWYQGIVEAAPDGLLVIDGSGLIILANPESELIFGCLKGGLLGKHYDVLVAQRHRHAFEEIRRTFLDGTTSGRAEQTACRFDGSEFPIELRLSNLPVRDNDKSSMCVVIRDLSLYQEQQRRLRLAHEQQQAIFSAAPYGIALIRDGRIAQANPSMHEIFGYASRELYGCSPVVWLGQQVWDSRLEEARARLRLGEILREELEVFRKDGSRFWASISIRAVQASNLKRGSIWIVKDVSERRAAAAQVQKAREMAEESAKVKSAFLANMSHEIRTPMNAIIGMTHLVMNTVLTEQQRDYLQKVQRSSQHLLGILDDILDFSKIEAGKLQVNESDFSLQGLLQDAMDFIRPRAMTKDIALSLFVDADVPDRLRGDTLRLKQALLNYLSNAVKFTDRGQITVGVRVLGHASDGLCLEFSVTDTGIGLSSEQCSHLFQSFQQADASTTRRFGGTGLGLVIVKELARLMGGEVGVSSHEGEGSKFWFSARLRQAESPVTQLLCPRPPAALAPTPLSARVLLVEDNDLNQQVASEMLKSMGCEVAIANNGQEALERVTSETYDLVLMDVHMPVLDGLAATRALREIRGLADLPVIAMTASAMQEDKDNCMAAGMNDFICKPFEPDTLYTVLQRWLEHTRPTPKAGSNPAACPFHLAGVDVADGMRLAMGDESLYRELLRLYWVGQKDIPAQLRRALDAGDLVEAASLLHVFKGVSRTIGANAIAEAADSLEQLVSSGCTREECRETLESLETQLGTVLHQVEQLFPQETLLSSHTPEVDPELLQQIGEQLMGLLADCDAEAQSVAAENAALLLAAFQGDAKRLLDAIQRFDFDAALSILRESLERFRSTPDCSARPRAEAGS